MENKACEYILSYIFKINSTRDLLSMFDTMTFKDAEILYKITFEYQVGINKRAIIIRNVEATDDKHGSIDVSEKKIKEMEKILNKSVGN